MSKESSSTAATNLRACLQSRRRPVPDTMRNLPRLLASRDGQGMDHSVLVAILDEALAIGANFGPSPSGAATRTPLALTALTTPQQKTPLPASSTDADRTTIERNADDEPMDDSKPAASPSPPSDHDP